MLRADDTLDQAERLKATVSVCMLVTPPASGLCSAFGDLQVGRLLPGLLAKIGVCSDVAKAPVSPSEKCQSWSTFTSGVFVFVEGRLSVWASPTETSGSAARSCCPRLVPYPFVAALCRRGHGDSTCVPPGSVRASCCGGPPFQ